MTKLRELIQEKTEVIDDMSRDYETVTHSLRNKYDSQASLEKKQHESEMSRAKEVIQKLNEESSLISSTVVNLKENI